jgi:predicted phage tail protein
VTWSIAAAAPAAPSGVSANAVSHQRIDVRWTDQSGDEDRFEVGRSTDGGGTWPITFNAPPSSELLTDDGLAASTTYTYRVRACNAIGCSAWSAQVSATTAPLPPSNVAAAAVSTTRIDVTWTNAGTGATGNVLERSQDGSTWATRATLAASATAFSDVEVAPGSGYHYRLRACRNGVCSGPSASAQATTPATPPSAAPGAPGSLTATGVGSAIIDLAWSASSGLVSEYRIERSTGDQSAFSQVAVVGGTVTTWSDQGLSPGTTYFYRVRAANALGTSDWSPVASATTSDSAPDVPGDLSVALITPSQVRVSWSAVTGVTHYQVRRSRSSGGWTVVAVNVPAGSTEYLDTPGDADTYRYAVRACAGGLCSSWSSPSQQLTVTAP